MNHEPRFGADEEREWEAQERARIALRDGSPLADVDADGRRYRLLARELGALPRVALPATFARTVARRVAIGSEPLLAPFERVFVSVLVVAFVVAAIAGIAAFGLVSPILDAVRGSAIVWNRWTLVLGACLLACAFGARPRTAVSR